MKYQPLSDYLAGQTGERVTLSFAQIQTIVGAVLPASARRYRPWWGNETAGSHVQARAWQDAGWRVDEVNLTAGWVSFARAR